MEAVKETKNRPFDILLYGAYGYTGKLILKQLQKSSLSFAVAGRNPQKIKQLIDAFSLSPAQAAIFPIADKNQRENFVQKGRLLIQCAGPYEPHARPFVQTAIQTQTHYLDITGEVKFIDWTRGWDQQAKKAGVVLANACGLDVVPSDYACYFASKGLDRIERLELYFLSSGGPSTGTLRSLFSIIKENSIGEPYSHAEAPKTIYIDRVIGSLPAFPMPLGDRITAQKTTNAKEIHTYLILPKRIYGEALRIFGPIFSLGLGLPGADRILSFLFPSGRGPTEEERKKSYYYFIAKAIAANGREQKAVIKGKDPYGFTAFAVVELAKRVLASDKSGWFSPATLFPPEDLVEVFKPYFTLRANTHQ